MNPNLMGDVALVTVLSVICILVRPNTTRTQRFGPKLYPLWFLLVIVVCGSWISIYLSNRPYQTAVKHLHTYESMNTTS